jgi:hypothetical protein
LAIPMSPEEERRAQGQLAVLAVGQLLPPYLVEARSSHVATWSAPVDRETNIRLLSMRPRCLALVNRTTGEVLADIPRQ